MIGSIHKTRLAPSPTGALHLGNARTFLINWILARQNNWKILLRIEDLDGPRIKSRADALAMEDLRWLRLDYDEGPVRQSSRAAEYQKAIDRLIPAGRAYPCVCSRREVELAASAPHAEDAATIYPGTCRGRFKSIEEAVAVTGKPAAVRFQAVDKPVLFRDQFAGNWVFNVARELGDFVICKSDGTAAYQLAVVVDDAAGGITQVVRGDDLIDSTPRQILLYEALGMAHLIPAYTHLPLVVGTDGRRLAKRHGDTRVEYYRRAGVSAGRMLALLARWCGIEDAGERIDHPGDLLGRFRIDRLAKTPIVFTADDDAWLKRS